MNRHHNRPTGVHSVILSTYRLLLVLFCASLLSACAFNPFAKPGIGSPVSWNKLSGWDTDNHAEAWPALVQNCTRRPKELAWQSLCDRVDDYQTVTDEQARQFFETHFQPHRVVGKGGHRKGLFTGYFEPLLFGSEIATDRYRYPLYSRPDSLLTVELAELYPDLTDRRIRGRIEGNRLVPFYSRAQIDSEPSPLAGQELLWVDDPHALFFLHIQGSGRVQMTDGRTVGVGYADQNGHKYVAIGRTLIDREELAAKDVTMFSIRRWLRENPSSASELMNTNPSYVFFQLREQPQTGPIGSMQVPLTSERSVAVDRRAISLGTPLWIETTLPDSASPEQEPAVKDSESGDYRRLVFAQDTGGAIRGPVRVDIFFGNGKRAEYLAGTMKNQGKVYALLPRPQQ